MSRKYVLAAGAAALGAAAMGRSGRPSRRIWLGMQGLPNQGRRDGVNPGVRRDVQAMYPRLKGRQPRVRYTHSDEGIVYLFGEDGLLLGWGNVGDKVSLPNSQSVDGLGVITGGVDTTPRLWPSDVAKLTSKGLPNRNEATPKGVGGSKNPVKFDAASVGKRWVLAKYHGLRDREVVAVDTGWRQWQYAGRGNAWLLELPSGKRVWDTGIMGKYFVIREAGGRSKGRRAERRRTYKTLGGLARAMGGRQQVSLDTIFSQRANLKGKGWTSIKYNLTYADATEIAEVLGGRQYTKRDVRNGLMYGRIADLPYSTRQRIVWNKGQGWSYVAGQDYSAETARIRNILKK